MASTFQQRALLRKLIYAGLMLLLFTASYLLRAHVIFAQAENLGLREESKGEVELTGSAVRLSLTGSRGLAVCFLWLAVQDKQRRHEWNEMELLVSSVAKLQPHFVSPWLFQSWNMSFNVSAECDSPYDKYFYICRGIQLLAEGEKRNQGSKKGNLEFPGNPDLRFHMGFYYQLKIGKSDENRTLRSFYQLSCMPESEREPDDQETGLEPKDENGRPRLHRERFRTFCEKHPRLVRRLREDLGCSTPQQVVSFLRRHQNVPSRYGKDMKLKQNALDRFPILAPRAIPGEPYFDDDKGQGSTLGDDFDNFVASRGWYRYAQQPLPPLDPFLGSFGWEWNKRKHRLPRMTHYIFRQYPALAQINIADQLAQEGWFDHRGWTIEAKGDKPWFTQTAGNGKKIEEKVLVGNSEKYSSQRAWERAYETLTDFGTRTQLRMPDEYDEWLTGLMRNVGGTIAAAGKPHLALPWLRTRAGEPGELTLRYMKLLRQRELAREEFERASGKVEPGQASSAMAQSQRANSIFSSVHQYRSMTGYKSHYYRAEAERAGAAVSARQHYFNAKEYELTYGNRRKSVEELQKWLVEWQALLERKPGFRDCDEIQEESYHRQLTYFDRFQQYQKTQLQNLFLETAGFAPSRVPLPLYVWLKASFQDPRDPDRPRWEEWQREQIARIIPARTMLGSAGPFSPRGPFDGLYPDGTPFIPDHVIGPLREKWMRIRIQRPEGRPGPPAGMARPGAVEPAALRGE